MRILCSTGLLFLFVALGYCSFGSEYSNISPYADWAPFSDWDPAQMNTNLEIDDWVEQLIQLDVDGDGRMEYAASGLFRTCSDPEYRLIVVDPLDGSVRLIERLLYRFGAFFPPGATVPDIFGCSESSFRYLRNLSNRSFAYDASIQLLGKSCTVESHSVFSLDLSGDGLNEFVAVPSLNGSSYTFIVAEHLPNGSFYDRGSVYFPSPGPNLQCSSTVQFYDINADLLQDLILCGWDILAPRCQIYRHNAGSHTLTLVSNSILPFGDGSLALGDLDGDGKADLLTVGRLQNNSNAFLMYKGDGSFGFSVAPPSISVPVVPFALGQLAIVPQSNSGGLGIYVVSIENNGLVRLYSNNGSGTFASKSIPSSPTLKGPKIDTKQLTSGVPTFTVFGGRRYRVLVNDRSFSIYIQDDSAIRTIFTEKNDPQRYSMAFSYAYLIDYNNDGCLDLNFGGNVFKLATYNLLFDGVCNGAFYSTGIALPNVYRGYSAWEDFNQDGVMEAFYHESPATSVLLSIYPDKTVISHPPGVLFFNSSTVNENLQGITGLCEITGDKYRELFIITSNIIDGQSVYAWHNLGNLSFSDYSTHFQPSIPLAVNGGFGCMQKTAANGGNKTTWNDLIVFGQGTSYMQYYQNLKNGTMKLVPIATKFLGGQSTSSQWKNGQLAIADFNGDELEDIVSAVEAAATTQTGVFIAHPNGTFINVSSLPNAVSMNDLTVISLNMNADGYLDLMLGAARSGGIATLLAFKNNGNLTFSDVSSSILPQNIGYFSGYLVSGDVNNDSFADVFATGRTDKVSCGFRLLSNKPIPIATTTTSAATSALPLISGSGETSSNSSPDDSSDASNTAAILGAALGGVGGLCLLGCILLLGCCLLCCMLALMVLIVVAVLGVIAVVVVAGLATFLGVDGFVLYKRLSARNQPAGNAFDTMDENDTVSAEELVRYGKHITEYPVIPWKNLKFIRKLGEGAFGEVMLAEWNGVEVAVKLFKSPSVQAVEDFKHEALMMAKVSHHPHIVRFLGAAFKSDSIGMVMALCTGGSLLSALQKGLLDEKKKLEVIQEVAGAVSFLHCMDIVHRDIAARNVLMNSNMRSKLADLGMSRVLERHRDEQETSCSVGPIRWMAPESIRGRKYSRASDCYAFGILCIEIFDNGRPPYYQIRALADVAMQVINDGLLPTIPDEMPPFLERLIRSLLSHTPENRPTMEEFLFSYQELLVKHSDSETSSLVNSVSSFSHTYSTIQ